MKITTLMLLGASILYLPQNAISAVGWTGQPAYGKNLESYPGQAYFTAPTVYGEAAEGGAFRPLRERPHPMPAPSNYRFRPWDGGYAGQRTVNKFIAPAGPASTRSVSYWGGAPVGRSQPMWRPPVGMPQQLSERNVSGNAPRTLPVPERLANQYIPGRYRFRPLRPARNMRETGQPHYRSLQVQIPERYIFRPLNPMRRSAPPVQVSQQQPYRPYSNGPFPDSGFWPHYPPTVQTLPDYRYAYGGFPMRGWYGAAPRYNSAPGWQMPYRPAIPDRKSVV